MKFLRGEYTPLNTVEISEKNLLHNLKFFKNLHQSVQIFPNLKSNAYGHGLKIIAEILRKSDIEYVVVDSLYEAYELLKYKFSKHILISGYVIPENLKTKKLPFSYVVWNEEQINSIIKYQPNAKLHLFIDTGMSREGVLYQNLPDIEKAILTNKYNFEGIMSHFASADEPNKDQSEEQILEFTKAIQYFQALGIDFKYHHISASAGLLTQNNSLFNSARLGLGLYGISPYSRINLKPVLSFKSMLIDIRRIKEGSKVVYNGTFKAKRDLTVGIVPAGYNDGVDRRLSNKCKMKISGTYCNIVGRVSMNITTIDISNVSDPYIGQEVVVYSRNPEDDNSVENVAKACDTIPWEILVHINGTMRRVLI